MFDATFIAGAVTAALADFLLTWLFAFWATMLFLVLFGRARNLVFLSVFSVILSFSITVAFTGLAVLLGAN